MVHRQNCKKKHYKSALQLIGKYSTLDMLLRQLRAQKKPEQSQDRIVILGAAP